VEFASVVDAVRCAVEVQQAMPERNTRVAADNRIELRIGINLGDVIVEGDDLYGDGVNIAARIEALADPGGVLVSNTVHDQVRHRLPFAFEDVGEQQVKNIARPVRVYRVREASAVATSRSVSALPLPEKPSIARDRMGTFGLPLGTAYYLKHRFGDAAAILLASLEQAPGLPVAYQLLASCYAHNGTARRSTRDRDTPQGDHAGRGAERYSIPQPRAPRAVPVGPALGGRRGHIVRN
jgi:hypothetical protein